MNLAASAGIHDVDYMPFSVPWTRFESPVLERQGMQHYWRTRADTQPAAWDLPFAVFEGSQLVGLQALGAQSFSVTKAVGTGSWVALPWQGRGIGKEMRAAVLHLAFDGLGADCALTSAFEDNAASAAVTRALGYLQNGWQIDDREGKPVRLLRYVLERPEWERRRRKDIQIQRLPACLSLLGLAA